jgi:hypothetical protein
LPDARSGAKTAAVDSRRIWLVIDPAQRLYEETANMSETRHSIEDLFPEDQVPQPTVEAILDYLDYKRTR